MTESHEIWAAPPGENRQVFLGAYTQARWQWAMKHHKFLRDKGYDQVEIRNIPTKHD